MSHIIGIGVGLTVAYALSKTELAQQIGEALGFGGMPEWAKK